MNRLIKKVAEETRGLKLSEIVKNVDQSTKDAMAKGVASRASSWLDSEVEDKDPEDLDSFDLAADFTEEMLKDPDEILEAVIDCFPEGVDDNNVYGASPEEKKEAVEWILTYADAALARLFEDGVLDAENNYEHQDPNENNYPYGPGMRQHDFI